MDIQQGTDGLRELALFAGAGGGILGGRLLGWRTVCAVEFDPYARDVLVARQNDGSLEPFPIWDDVQTFDGRSWRGAVDVVSGGFPCQDISCAGKGDGLEGARSGLWREMARIVGEVRPRFVFVENSPMLTSRGLGVVLGDLAELGFDARWGVVGADDAGAPHRRKRIWILAASRDGMADAERLRRSTGVGAHGGTAGGPGRDWAASETKGRGRVPHQAYGDGDSPSTLRHPHGDGEPTLPVDAEVAWVPGDVADAHQGRLERSVPSSKTESDADATSRSSIAGWRLSEPDVC